MAQLSDVLQILAPIAALLLSIPSALVALKDLRTKSADQDALGAQGVGTSKVWVPPTNAERRSSALPPPPPQPPPPPPPRGTELGSHRPGTTDRAGRQPLEETTAGTAWVAPLGLGRRTLAFFINIWFIPLLLFSTAGGIGSALDPLTEEERRSGVDYSTGASIGYWVGVALTLIFAIWNIRRAAISGRSIGLRIVGGAALDEDTGLPIGLGRVLKRTWWVWLTLCWFGYVVPLSSLGRPDRRTWTDRSANAVVVRFDQRESARRPRPVVAEPRIT